jgi:hypothetical protein
MARIIYSGLVTSIRGSVGGTTFQNNAYGFTIKNKANMIIPNSQQQELRKLIFSLATKSWSSLTDAQRSNWDTYASTFPQFAKNNPSAQLSGFAIFVKWHAAWFLHSGLSASLDVAPALTATPLDTVSIELENHLGVLTLTPDWVIGDETWNVNYFISRPFQPSQNFSGSSPKFLIGSTNQDAAIIVTSQYLALYGSLPAVGSAVNIAIQLFDESGGKVLATSVQRIIVG